jgi:hypothetical protein
MIPPPPYKLNFCSGSELSMEELLTGLGEFHQILISIKIHFVLFVR